MKKWTLLTGALVLSLSQTTLSAGTHSAVGSASVPAKLLNSTAYPTHVTTRRDAHTREPCAPALWHREQRPSAAL